MTSLGLIQQIFGGLGWVRLGYVRLGLVRLGSFQYQKYYPNDIIYGIL